VVTVKDRQIAECVTLIIGGLAIAGWSATRPVGFTPGILFGVAVAAVAIANLPRLLTVRAIRKRAERRGGYVR
jgi:hypothetical protein